MDKMIFKHSVENRWKTNDFILALIKCLENDHNKLSE